MKKTFYTLSFFCISFIIVSCSADEVIDNSSKVNLPELFPLTFASESLSKSQDEQQKAPVTRIVVDPTYGTSFLWEGDEVVKAVDMTNNYYGVKLQDGSRNTTKKLYDMNVKNAGSNATFDGDLPIHGLNKVDGDEGEVNVFAYSTEDHGSIYPVTDGDYDNDYLMINFPSTRTFKINPQNSDNSERNADYGRNLPFVSEPIVNKKVTWDASINKANFVGSSPLFNFRPIFVTVRILLYFKPESVQDVSVHKYTANVELLDEGVTFDASLKLDVEKFTNLSSTTSKTTAQMVEAAKISSSTNNNTMTSNISYYNGNEKLEVPLDDRLIPSGRIKYLVVPVFVSRTTDYVDNLSVQVQLFNKYNMPIAFIMKTVDFTGYGPQWNYGETVNVTLREGDANCTFMWY